MDKSELSVRYQKYIACLNRRDWAGFESFVDGDVSYNGEQIGLSGYRRLLETDFDAIPDLHFNIEFLVADPPRVASRLLFECTPSATFLGLPVNGRTVSFSENVFYEFRNEKIVTVWSVIDRAAIERQLR